MIHMMRSVMIAKSSKGGSVGGNNRNDNAVAVRNEGYIPVSVRISISKVRIIPVDFIIVQNKKR